jgi:hypothetical protein
MMPSQQRSILHFFTDFKWEWQWHAGLLISDTRPAYTRFTEDLQGFTAVLRQWELNKESALPETCLAGTTGSDL